MPGERRQPVDDFRTGGVLVATRAMYEGLVLPGSEEIWWSSPGNLPDAVERRTRSARGGRVIALVGDPPLADDRRLLDIIRLVQSEFVHGADSDET
jgi:hypothetical protein